MTGSALGSVSDGYHTFDELYEHRAVLWIALCRLLAERQGLMIWRSLRHSDGGGYEGWFVLGAGVLQGSQITYHLPLARWGETAFAETLERAPFFDGHTSADVLDRLAQLGQGADSDTRGSA